MVETPIIGAKGAFQGFLNGVDTNLTTVIPDPGIGGTIDVSNSGTCILTHDTSSFSRTLPAPTFIGQKIDLVLDTISSGTLTVSTPAGYDSGGTNGSLLFTVAGQSARVYAVEEGGTIVWRVLRADKSEPALS